MCQILMYLLAGFRRTNLSRCGMLIGVHFIFKARGLRCVMSVTFGMFMGRTTMQGLFGVLRTDAKRTPQVFFGKGKVNAFSDAYS